MSCVTGVTAGAAIYGVPVYAMFLRVNTIIDGQTIESVNQANQISHMYVNCNTDFAQKCAVQYAYGYLSAANNTISKWDGGLMDNNLNGTGKALFSVSAPIVCNILTRCPSFLLPSIRIVFTIDPLSNFTTSATAATLTGFSISNIQIIW